MSSGVGSNSGGRDMDASEVGVSLLDETVVKTNGRLRALSSDRAPSDTSEQLHFPWEKIGPPEEGIFQKLLKKSKSGYAKRRQTYTWLDWLGVFLPCVSWLRTYKIREYLLPDIIAGISVGFMVIPQGMSYANLAGLPSVYGLYGAFLPVLAYALIGSSRHLAVGPVAVTSLLLGSSLKDIVEGADQIANPNSPGDLADVQQKYNVAAIQIAFLVSILYTSVGVFRLGFITNFLSHSVIGGFTSGAAITIGLSQLKYILGINVARKDALHEQIKEYIDNMPDFKWQEFIMGMTLLVLLVSFKEVGKRSQRFRWLRPLGPITACIISLCAVYIGKVDQYGIKIIGSIPKGLPKPTVQWWAPMPDFVKLIPVAIVVMVVDLLESTSIARALAVKNNYELNSNQEITGLGLANLAGAAFNAYTTTGSFSRSAVNNDSGAKTALSGFITAWVVAFVLLFLTPVFSKLTYNALGAIVVSAVTGLLEYEQAINLFKINKLDWLVWMASFLGTLFISIEIGLGISIGLALLIVVYESAFPHTALLGRIPNTGVYRNVKQYPDASVFPGIMLCRIDAPMYFANVQWIRDRMRKYEKAAAEYSAVKGMQLEYIIIDMSPVTHIDATGVHALESWINDHHAAGMQTIICNPNSKVIRCLETAGVPDLIGREWVFVTVHDAVSFCTRALTEKGHVVQGEPSRTLKALTQGSMRTGTSLSGAVGENGVNGVNGTPGNGVHVAAGMTLPVNRSSASDSE